MSAAVGSPDLVSWLTQFKDPIEIRDTQGLVIGVFVPQKKSEAEQLKCLFDWEEVKRVAAQQQTGRPLREILHDLQKRGEGK